MQTNAISARKYRFNIGVLGFPDEALAAAVYRPLHGILDDIVHRTRTQEETVFHVQGTSELSFDFYASPRVTSPLFIDWYRAWGQGEMAAVLPGDAEKDEPYAAPDIYQTVLSGYDLKKNGDNALIGWIANQADIGLIVQGGDAADGGNARNFINQCAENKIPCLLLEATDGAVSIHWFESGYPVPYAPKKLAAYIAGLYPKGEDLGSVDKGGVNLSDPFTFTYQEQTIHDRTVQVPDREDFAPKRFCGYRWLEMASKRFEKKHDIAPRYSQDVSRDMLSAYENKQKALQKNKFQSQILNGAYPLQIDSPDAEAIRANHEDYCECFHYYSHCGDRCNDVHRSFTYFRVHAPLWASICLALGFYAETLLGTYLPGWLGPLWVALASLGFLLGGVSVWVLRAANRAVTENKRKFLFLRYVSENLRALPYHSAFGLPFDSRFLHEDIASSQDAVRAASAKILRRALRYKRLARYRIDAAALRHVSDHLDRYLIEQQEYQQKRVIRFKRISKGLEKQLKGWMVIQLVTLFTRGVFRFVLGIWGKALFVDKDARDFAGALANCLAMMLPAIFDLKSRQKNGEGYATYLSIAENTTKNLDGLQQKMAAARGQSALGYEEMVVLGDDILDKILAEQAAWHNAIAGQ
ncbi:MAG: hypothetical protein LBN04_04185 [Oscillospiraceae bacterium]|jgi:hypothetical protein|nr:hypothetical protein [Oscillospiraceae bacterium]